MIVVLSDEAKLDLARIGNYIAQDSPKRAVTFARELMRSCLALGELPYAWPLMQRHEHTGIRRCVYRGYLIFYRIEPASIGIVHIMHGAMDYESLLFQGEAAPR